MSTILCKLKIKELNLTKHNPLTEHEHTRFGNRWYPGVMAAYQIVDDRLSEKGKIRDKCLSAFLGKSAFFWKIIFIVQKFILNFGREKERYLVQFYDKSLYANIRSKMQSYNVKMPHRKEKGRYLTQSYNKSPYNHRKIQKATWVKKITPKTSITQRLRTDLRRSDGMMTASQPVLLNWCTGSKPSHLPQSCRIKRTQIYQSLLCRKNEKKKHPLPWFTIMDDNTLMSKTRKMN